MPLKRMARNAVCWLLASLLILLGYVNRAKNESFQDGVITSIYFHNPSRKLFSKIVTWLRDNEYTFISCEQLLEIINKRIACPRGAVWISLDDGWRENINNVIPIAVEYDVPITLFIYTSAVEEGTFWWKRVREYAKLLPSEHRDVESIQQSPEEVRKQVLQSVAQVETLDSFKRDAMMVEDVRRIAAIPQVTIGSHTVTHPILQNCNDTQIDYELGESKRKLENWTGKTVRAFAYPKGSFTGRERQYLTKHGYELAANIESRLARLDGDRYLFPRTEVMNDGSFAENLCHALGVWAPIVSKLKRIIKPGIRVQSNPEKPHNLAKSVTVK